VSSSTIVTALPLAAADPATLREYARDPGWDRLRLLSAGESTFKICVTLCESAAGFSLAVLTVGLLTIHARIIFGRAFLITTVRGLLGVASVAYV